MKHDTNPKLFVLQFGALASLYVVVASLLTLVFTIINLHVPDATDSVWSYEQYMSSARFAIAVIVVFFPVYLTLTTLVLRARHKQEVTYLPVVRWLLYLSLLVASGVLLGNLVWVLVSFLEGEVTLRFMLKVLTVLVVVGIALGFYGLDVRDYWLRRPRKLRAAFLAVVSLVVIAVFAGFYSIISPSEARERSLDARQVQELQEIAQYINTYIERERALPESVEAVFPPALDVPTAPEDRSAYEYRAGTDLTYELCATFAADSATNYGYRPSVPREQFMVDWNYRAGDWCFEIEANLPEEINDAESL